MKPLRHGPAEPKLKSFASAKGAKRPVGFRLVAGIQG